MASVPDLKEKGMNCPTCNRHVNDPHQRRNERVERRPLTEHCADPCHWPHLDDEALDWLTSKAWSAYSNAATRARGTHTPSARLADDLYLKYTALRAVPRGETVTA